MPSWENTPATERACAQCGDSFMAKRSTAKFCSSRCRGRARAPRPSPTAEQRRAWREARLERPGYRERVNAQGRERARRVREFVNAYKVRVGCVDCGYRANPVALDFDHIGNLKTRNVSASKSIEQARSEIAHCEVRCANCHRIKTHERLHQSSTAS